jgi:hypothetical protein
MYNFSAYFVAQLLLQIPYMFLLSLFCIGVSGYGIGNWNLDAFFPFLLVHAVFMFTFECVAQLYAVQFRHPLLGMFQVVNFWFACFLFGGFLIPESDTPWPFRVFTYFSPIKYAVKALMNLEYKGTEWKGAVLANAGRGFYCPGNPISCYGATGDQVLETMGSTVAHSAQVESELFRDVMCMLAIALVFKLFYFIVAALKCYESNEVKPSHDPAVKLLTTSTLLTSTTTSVKKMDRSESADDATDV